MRPDKKAQYGEEVVEEKFGGDAEAGTGRRFIAPNPASMLDFEGTEMLMIPEKHEVDEIMTDEKTEQGSWDPFPNSGISSHAAWG